MITVYYGQRRMLTLARSFLLDRTMSPYRRLSATLFLGCKGPVQLEVGDGFMLDTRAALLAPKVPRRRTVALDSEIAIFDIPVGTPEFVTLAPTLAKQQILALDFERFAHLVPTLARGPDGGLDCAEVDALFRAVVEAITGETPGSRPLDRRVAAALAAIEEMPLDEVSLPVLAKRLRLSTSRLRHLVRDELGCSLTHYARWVAVWKAARAWKQGTPFTELAHAAGFYDLAHLDHAFVETFGVNPSTVIDPSQITLVRCE
jgi:AraC-like DNA-binding protein